MTEEMKREIGEKLLEMIGIVAEGLGCQYNCQILTSTTLDIIDEDQDEKLPN